MTHFYSISELSLLVCLSERQLRYLDQLKILTPSYSRGDRRYSDLDALLAALIAILRRKHIPLQRIRVHIPVLRRQFTKGVPRYVVFSESLSEKIMFSESDHELLQIAGLLRWDAYVVDTRDLYTMLAGTRWAA
jgi:DNA-binding transcriptional MerR regulator